MTLTQLVVTVKTGPLTEDVAEREHAVVETALIEGVNKIIADLVPQVGFNMEVTVG